MSQSEVQPELPQSGPRAALAQALTRRRERLLSAAQALPDATQLALLVFDLLTQLAREPAADVEEENLHVMAARQGMGGVVERPLGPGMPPLGAVLAGSVVDGNAVELAGALLALGFAARLAEEPLAQRRDFTVKVVSLLPAVERFGRFILTDYVDLILSEDDALRFWQVYSDRVASEVSRRAREREPTEDGATWLLAALLKFHDRGPDVGRGSAWTPLRRHVQRILETGRHRWRFVRSLVEGCQDPRMLHSVCLSPAFSSDPEILRVFAAQSGPTPRSCALFALQVHGDPGGVVEGILTALKGRPIEEIGERVVELHGLASLPKTPSTALVTLARGLELIGRTLGPGLAKLVAEDARALRTLVLLVNLAAPEGRLVAPEARPLLVRAADIFFEVFSLSYAAHPLVDEVFREAASRALAGLLGVGDERLSRRLEALGLGFEAEVGRWSERREERQRLFERFVTLFLHVLAGAGRLLYAEPGTRHAGIETYRLALRIYVEVAERMPMAGWAGALEPVVESAFPELIREASVDISSVSSAAEVVAEVDQGLFSATRPVEIDAHWAQPTTSAPSGPSGPPLLRYRPTRQAPLVAPATVIRASRGGSLGNLIAAYSGFFLITALVGGLRRLLGISAKAQLELTDQELVLRERKAVLGEDLGNAGRSRRLDELAGVSVRRALRIFPLVFGLFTLLSAGLLGGHVLFAGLRGQDGQVALLGGALLGFGLVVDAVMTRISIRNRRSIEVDLRFSSPMGRWTVLVDREEGALLLDALMATDAELRASRGPDDLGD